MVTLISIILFLALIAYIVTYMKLPEPYGKVIQVILLVLMIVAIGRFINGGEAGMKF